MNVPRLGAHASGLFPFYAVNHPCCAHTTHFDTGELPMNSGNAGSVKLSLPAQKTKGARVLHVASLDPDVIRQVFAEKGPKAEIFTGYCVECSRPFTIRAGTAVRTLAQYGRFIPQTLCADDFQMWKGRHTTQLPANTSVRRPRTALGDLPDRELNRLMRDYVGKLMTVHFKDKVGFSDQDESKTPEVGVVLSINKAALVLVSPGDEVHTGRVYALKDISHMRYERKPKAEAPCAVTELAVAAS